MEAQWLPSDMLWGQKILIDKLISFNNRKSTIVAMLYSSTLNNLFTYNQKKYFSAVSRNSITGKVFFSMPFINSCGENTMFYFSKLFLGYFPNFCMGGNNFAVFKAVFLFLCLSIFVEINNHIFISIFFLHQRPSIIVWAKNNCSCLWKVCTNHLILEALREEVAGCLNVLRNIVFVALLTQKDSPQLTFYIRSLLFLAITLKRKLKSFSSDYKYLWQLIISKARININFKGRHCNSKLTPFQRFDTNFKGILQNWPSQRLDTNFKDILQNWHHLKDLTPISKAYSKRDTILKTTIDTKFSKLIETITS